MLKKILDSDNKIFKLVCGAGNEYTDEVEKLAYIYSKAGAQIFDICAKKDILKAVKKGIQSSGITKNRYICVSVGMKGDPHILKAKINESECIRCGICSNTCPNDAIINFKVDEKKCIGCALCQKNCQNLAINMAEKDTNLAIVLPELVKMGIDCIELHATSEFDEDIWEKWEIINNCFDGILSICIDRQNLGNKQILKRLKMMLKSREPYTTIIQADGIPMSGCDDEYKTTLQAVAMTEIIQDFNLPVYIFISGGTNSRTAKLAQICGLKYNGISVGSYARMIVKNSLKCDNIEKTIDLAKKLVKECIC